MLQGHLQLCFQEIRRRKEEGIIKYKRYDRNYKQNLLRSVNDRNKHRFEGLWPLPNGVSYNSYIIDDEKVAMVDTVEVDFFTQFLENIHEAIGDREIDYLIINHMEPDHSGLSPHQEILP